MAFCFYDSLLVATFRQQVREAGLASGHIPVVHLPMDVAKHVQCLPKHGVCLCHATGPMQYASETVNTMSNALTEARMAACCGHGKAPSA